MISRRNLPHKTRWVKTVLIGTVFGFLVCLLVAVFSMYDGRSHLGDTINESIKRRYKAIDDASSNLDFKYEVHQVKMEDHLG